MKLQNTPNRIDHFPFYATDPSSWAHIKGKRLNAVWQDIETHTKASITSIDVELLQMISLDKDDCVIDSKIIAVGTKDHLHAKIRYVAEQALQTETFGVILAHNHTCGEALPSWDDITYTKNLNHAFKLLNISLIDHLIVARDRVFSMRRNCLIF